jgi:tRNA A-37 threonylcarbamoyl transferase component Bud32
MTNWPRYPDPRERARGARGRRIPGEAMVATLVRVLLLVLGQFGILLCVLFLPLSGLFLWRMLLELPSGAAAAPGLFDPLVRRFTDPLIERLGLELHVTVEGAPLDAAPAAVAAGFLAAAVLLAWLSARTLRSAERRREARSVPQARVAVAAAGAPLAEAPAVTTGMGTGGAGAAADATTIPPAPALDRPARVGRYEIVSVLGQGAMGVVYAGRDPNLGRQVAIKTYLAQYIDPGTVEQYVQRFEREAQVCGQLSHPAIVAIHDVVHDAAGQPYIVMEFVVGRPLTALIREGPVPLAQALRIAIDVAEALDHAHAQGIVHRDIKPDNILVTRDGHAKVADFGIARLRNSEMTRTGQSFGTPSFMSPEQFLDSRVDARSDIFSFGATLYALFTGARPFTGRNVVEVGGQIMRHEPPVPSALAPGLPAAIDAVVMRCLGKAPEARYAAAGEIAAALRSLLPS